MLILTGGLVLGETMALWMTAKEEWFGLAAVLLVFACGKTAADSRAWKGRCMAPALLFLFGLTAGMMRMKWEEKAFEKESVIYPQSAAEVIGEISEIGATDSGCRLVLKNCRISNERIRRIYCYLDQGENLKLGMKIRVIGNLEFPERARNPGQFNFHGYCRAKGISGIQKGESMEILSSEYLWVQEKLREFGLACSEQIDRISEDSDHGILKAILLGDRSDMNETIYETYRKNGISHVLAISGLHVSVIGMGLWKVLRKAGLGYCSAGTAAFLFLFAYGSVTGFGPSVVRSVFMMGISFLAGVFGRTYDMPTAMCIPAIGLIWIRPFLITQASFQLSFLAVGTVFFAGEYLEKYWKMCGWKKDFFTGVWIQMVTIPVILYHSYEIAPYSIFLNPVIIPLMTYVLISGLAALGVSFFSLQAAQFCLGGAHYILEFYLKICEVIGKIPGAGLILGRPLIICILLYYMVLLAAGYLSVKKRLAGILLLCTGFFFLIPVGKKGLQVTFLDVGQGDGIFLESEGYTMLVDCGSSQERKVGEDCLIPYLKYNGIRRVDTLVISHADEDHVNGIRYLLETPSCDIEVGRMVLPDDGAVDKEEEALIRLAQIREIPVVFYGAGDRLKDVLGSKILVECLHPENTGDTDRNENSLVLRIRYDDFQLLLTGDAGGEAEQLMLHKQSLGPVSVLKAGHHGSASSSGIEFLNLIQPDVVILSYGKGNSYGHPDADVLKRCESVGAEIFETAELGAIRLWTDGKSMQIGGWFDIRNGI